MSIMDIGEEDANDNDGGQQDLGDEYDRWDVSDLTYTKQHPASAVGGTPVALRYYPPSPNSNDDNPRGYHGLIVDDPFVKTDEDGLDQSVVVESSGSSGDDFKVVNLADEKTTVLTNEGPKDATEEDVDFDAANGVDFDGDAFYGNIIADAEFPVDRTIIKLTGNAGRSAVRCLDVSGLENADVVRDENGTPILDENGALDINDGLVEKHPGNTDSDYTPPRFVRHGQLRPDVYNSGRPDIRSEQLPDVGEVDADTVAVLLRRTENVIDDYSGNSYWATVTFKDDGEFTSMEPTDEYEPDEALVEATHWMEWNFPSTERIEELQAQQTGSTGGSGSSDSAIGAQ